MRGDLSAKRYIHADETDGSSGRHTEESGLLDLQPGTTVIHLVHTAYEESGEILEVSESIWPADRVIVLDDYEFRKNPKIFRPVRRLSK